MSDREKVIKGLETCIKYIDRDCPIDCPYYETCTKYEGRVVFQPVLRDALALLKEQEAEIEHMKRPDCEHAEHDGTGCLGYCGCTQDDEPIESCKRCEKYTGNISEAVKWWEC